jgi:hypothetical protein
MSRDYHDQGIPDAADSGSKKTFLLVMCSRFRLFMVLSSELQRLYQLIRQPKPVTDRRFEMEFLDSGVGTFAFTSG